MRKRGACVLCVLCAPLSRSPILIERADHILTSCLTTDTPHC